MIRVYADGVIAYDSRLDDYALQGLTITTGLNKGGTARITMPPYHPAYGLFTEYSTIVEIYRDTELKFRGRALHHIDDVNNSRTVVCEGELCFFLDTVCRPYLYQDTPAAIFAEIVQTHNTQAPADRQFKVGTVTVTDANDYVRLENGSAESTFDTLGKLRERCGGYFVFTTDADDGTRVINWYEKLNYRSSQRIKLGENMLDFSRTGENTSLITAVLPYGAKDEETGVYLTIESVNNGVDYIQDDEAVALRGLIIRPVIWDDVTQPANLLRKAQEYLAQNRYIITSLTLSALDLSYVDQDIDRFQIGDLIRVESKAHRLDEDFLLTDRSEDLLNPSADQIMLGKDLQTLTSADVAGDKHNQSEIGKVVHQITADYTLNIANAVQETEKLLASLIEQTSEAIKLEVAETYTTNDQLTASITSSMTQLADQFLFEFETLKTTVDENDAEARAQITEIYKYISFEGGAIKLGASDSAITLTIENDMIVFRKNGAQFGWWDGVDFHTGNIVVEVNERAQFGNFAFIPEPNGSLSFLKIGG
jgi:phage minor structural protein